MTRAPALAALPLLAGAALLLSGCWRGNPDRPVIVDLIGAPETLSPIGRGPVQQIVAGAVAQGLVSYEAQGEITGALAESWIVADEGRSYIFRLKRLDWTDGKPLKSEEVARQLRARMSAAPDLLAGLQPKIRAMTEQVIEIRLEAPMPNFLQILADPRLAVARGEEGIGTGPYAGRLDQGRLRLTPVPDPLEESEARADIRPIDRRTLESGRAALAIVRFREGRTDLVLGGRFQHLPLLAVAGDIRPSSIRADPVPGLFGLLFAGDSDFTADAQVRAAIAQAIDRDALASALNLGGWTVIDRPLPAALDLGRAPTAPAWSSVALGARQANAQGVIARWVAGHGPAPMLRVALPAGPGANMLFIRLAADLGRIGIRLDRVGEDEKADLVLIDETSPFDSALWYLSRLACAEGPGCDPAAIDALQAARASGDDEERARLLAEAEQRVVAGGRYIPLGLPIRWSLVARRLTGFQPSPRAIHPLNRLVASPN